MNKKKAALLCVIILIMAVIFRFSAHTGSESSELSINVTRFISRIIFRNFGSMTLSQQQFIVAEFHHFIRKLAHFSEYLILALLWLNALRLSKVKKKYLIAVIICALYAMTDEFHQTFILGRSGEYIDVLIDSSGSLTGTLFYFIISKFKH